MHPPTLAHLHRPHAAHAPTHSRARSIGAARWRARAWHRLHAVAADLPGSVQTSLFEAFKDTPVIVDRMILKATSMALDSYVFSDANDQARVLLQKAHDTVCLQRPAPARTNRELRVPF
jgi:hypothetical protein